MNGPSDTPRSKGMAMIAAYRAERLNQRPVLRTSLRAAHRALRGSRQAQPTSDDPPDPAAASPQEPAMPDAVQPVSVFANLVSLAEAERQSEAAHNEPDSAPADTAEPAPTSQDTPDAAPEPAPAASNGPDTISMAPEPPPPDAPASDPQPCASRPNDPPLAEIGFGPGMLIRLSQLGLHTTGDLAQANPAELRAALGDISRLVDVETWIAAARQSRTSPSP